MAGWKECSLFHVLGFLTFIVSPQLEAALTHLVQTWTALAGGQYRDNTSIP